ncbi:MAG: hypothetical protein PHH55_06045 [Candidatus Delongbacteria bacterium]|nr:hypothetical protein [Candidatus Delongbacteria bacterium]
MTESIAFAGGDDGEQRKDGIEEGLTRAEFASVMSDLEHFVLFGGIEQAC